MQEEVIVRQALSAEHAAEYDSVHQSTASLRLLRQELSVLAAAEAESAAAPPDQETAAHRQLVVPPGQASGVAAGTYHAPYASARVHHTAQPAEYCTLPTGLPT